ncbi:MAG TPA: sigma-70 family RNA polymerase sigma factor [Vicinamibacterales bacterium]|nr:sigma-70 family RNA polymerase sigma factor [Vicinamibacterales bacterium]
MDDADLVRTFQRTGDASSFAALVRRHERTVFRVVLSVLGPGQHAAAEDLTQDVFVKVYRRVGQFRGDARFSSWLYRIAYNEAVQYRSSRPFRTESLPEEVMALVPTERPQDDPFRAATDERRAALVEECLSRLPDLYRSVLHLHYWMGMTVAEISDAMSAPPGTIKSYLHRARARLHVLLREKGIADA